MLYKWNERAWASLASRAEQLPHALLIHGPSGIGKRALAEHFAQFLLCEGPRSAVGACGRCEACRWFCAGNHPDARWLEPESIAKPPLGEDEGEGEGRSPTRAAKPSLEIRVEQVRALADFLNLGSHRGKLRIALIHPAEDMNLHAANALLKSLEEPPPGAVFLLVSHRPARLLPTIRSRCVALPVGVPERAQADAWLRENGVADPGPWLAFAGGAPLQALEYACGPRGEVITRVLRAILGGPRRSVTAGDREEVEALAEVLQKLALDQAFAASGVDPKYATGAAPAPRAQASDWLAFARAMGRNRALARHPLNPKLFAAEMMGAMPPIKRRRWKT